jgi:hypothetical protein
LFWVLYEFCVVWGAHIAGIPVEETALSFAPVLLIAGGMAGARLRGLMHRVRHPRGDE